MTTVLERATSTLPTIRTWQELVTPERASELLSRNLGNRPVSDGRVTTYATAMRMGRWRTTPEPIILGLQDELLNGQHRLLALIRAGTAVEMTLSAGWPAEIFAVLDSGAKRSSADRLHGIGYQNCNILAAMAGWQCRWERRKVTTSIVNAEVGFDDLRITLERNPGLVEITRRSHDRHMGELRPIPPAGALWAYYQMQRRDEDAAERFMEQVFRGENLTAADPAYVLRERLRRMRETSTRRMAPPQWVSIAMLVRAWNGFVLDKSVGLSGQGLTTKIGARFPNFAPRLPGDPDFRESADGKH